MTQASSLAEALQGLLSNPEAGWFTPIPIAIQGLTPKQAVKVPAPRFNSIWGVINHIRYWQEVILLRLQGITFDKRALGGNNSWPPAPIRPSLQEWQADQQRLLDANHKLAEFITTLKDEVIFQPVAAGKPSLFQVIQGVIAHNSYHTCEIISIRHMHGWWLERT